MTKPKYMESDAAHGERTFEYAGRLQEIVKPDSPDDLDMSATEFVHAIKELGSNIMCEMFDWVCRDGENTFSNMDEVAMIMALDIVKDHVVSDIDSRTVILGMAMSELYNRGVDELKKQDEADEEPAA